MIQITAYTFAIENGCQKFDGNDLAKVLILTISLNKIYLGYLYLI